MEGDFSLTGLEDVIVSPSARKKRRVRGVLTDIGGEICKSSSRRGGLGGCDGVGVRAFESPRFSVSRTSTAGSSEREGREFYAKKGNILVTCT